MLLQNFGQEVALTDDVVHDLLRIARNPANSLRYRVEAYSVARAWSERTDRLLGLNLEVVKRGAKFAVIGPKYPCGPSTAPMSVGRRSSTAMPSGGWSVHRRARSR